MSAVTIERRPIRFAGHPARSGPLTWAQRHMWEQRIWMLPNDTFVNETQGVPVPPGTSLETVLIALESLLSRYEALRTLFPDETTQQVRAEGEVEVEIVRVGGSVAPDELQRLAGEQEQRLLQTPFDPATQLSFRAVIGVVAGEPRVVLLGLSHLTADLLSCRLLIAELGGLLSGRTPAAQPVRHPIDQAEHEASPAGEKTARKAIAYWAGELAAGDPAMFTAPPIEPATPRYWRGALRSRAAAAALPILAARHRSSTATVLLTGIATVLGERTGRDRCVLRLVAGNRFTPELRAAVGNLTQEIVASIDLRAADFGQRMKATWSATMRAYRHGSYPPEPVRELIAATPHGIDCCVNDLFTPMQGAAAPDPVHLGERGEFAWERRTEKAGVRFFLEAFDERADPSIVRLSLLADTAHLPPDQVEATLRELEALLVGLAHD
ncbi:MAG TPA: condensation domain-containing protein [Mycobacteriales bacterium]|nr:condensation domain-containing protein [Mycobacteriales bacterium]